MPIHRTSPNHGSHPLDYVTDVAGVLQPLMTLPQVLEIYTTHNVSGLSLLTWAAYALLGLVFLAYAIVHNLKPIIISQVIWFVFNVTVVLGILVYR